MRDDCRRSGSKWVKVGCEFRKYQRENTIKRLTLHFINNNKTILVVSAIQGSQKWKNIESEKYGGTIANVVWERLHIT